MAVRSSNRRSSNSRGSGASAISVRRGRSSRARSNSNRSNRAARNGPDDAVVVAAADAVAPKGSRIRVGSNRSRRSNRSNRDPLGSRASRGRKAKPAAAAKEKNGVSEDVAAVVVAAETRRQAGDPLPCSAGSAAGSGAGRFSRR